MTPRTNTNEELDGFSETANRSTEDLAKLMSEEGFIATGVILFFIGFFGFFLNLIVITLMVKDKEVRYFIHHSLTMSDL